MQVIKVCVFIIEGLNSTEEFSSMVGHSYRCGAQMRVQLCALKLFSFLLSVYVQTVIMINRPILWSIKLWKSIKGPQINRETF